MRRHLIDIISDIVDQRLKPTGSIVSINETSPGVYQITSSEIDTILIDSQIVEISDTVGFNGKFQVSNVDYDNSTFTIESTSGIAIPGTFGEWTGQAVFFYFENVPGYSEHLSNENIQNLIDQKRFPSIYMTTPFSKQTKLRNRLEKITRVVFHILNYTDPSIKMPVRHTDTFPYLRDIKEKFFEGLESSPELLGELTVDEEEMFLGSPEQNILNSTVDAIRLELSDFLIINKSC